MIILFKKLIFIIWHLLRVQPVLFFFRIFCGTWNTNGQAASVPIDDWLSPPEDADPPDIYAIGLD